MRTAFLFFLLATVSAAQTIAVRGETVYPMAGAALKNGVVLIRDGKIERIGTMGTPAGYRELRAKVVTPGLIDAHATVGLTGYLNQPHDQDQVERSATVQPELRAIDAYNARERLVEWVRGFGVTAMHTGHGPGILVSGQTMIVKTRGNTAEEAAIVKEAMVAATLGSGARENGARSPGTRAKAIAILRSEFIKAQEYTAKKEKARDLRTETFARILRGELPLLVTVHRANDILSAIRLGKEFGIKLVLDGVAEAPLVMAEIKASGYPVIVHPTMYRSGGDTENISFETASKLKAAGVPFALQTGFEGYVPKVRVLLFEAGVAAAHGLKFEDALASVTIDAARLLGIANRVGSLEAGKDADLAMYDGDPFEYATHCTGVIIDGVVVSTEAR
ncbi:MAG: amidohydrolase family protein [Bryobacterales bacterium]|nr:amidohydrolase family protein [Bryobacterales bacterium]